MSHLSFSWLIAGQLAGHAAPSSVDDLRYLKQQGVHALVRMVEANKAAIAPVQIENHGLKDCHEPVVDFSAPTPGQLDKMISFIASSLAGGKPVGVSCHAGLGRTGTVLACYLVSQGYEAPQAIAEVRAKRPGSIETVVQMQAVTEYARRMRKG